MTTRKLSLYEIMNIENMVEQGATVEVVSEMYETTPDIINSMLIMSASNLNLFPQHKKDQYLDTYVCDDLLKEYNVEIVVKKPVAKRTTKSK